MATQASKPAGIVGQVSFVILMLALTALFVTLGFWQVQRLSEKEALIWAVETRLSQAPTPFPAVAQWQAIDPEALDYTPMSLRGSFDHSKTVLVFTNLPEPKGRYGRAGYWVMAPFETDESAIVWVNRGFVPESQAEAFADGGVAPEGQLTIEGTVRRPDEANSFTPEADYADRRAWVRDPERLSLVAGITGKPVAPVTIDLPAGEPGDLPQGGETQVSFSNRHLEYAGTWFSFAAITPIMLGFWLWRQRRSANLAQKDGQD